jgi:hypothetical protein
MSKQPTPEQIVIAERTFCEKNAPKFPAKTGRLPILSFSEMLALLVFWQILKIRTFFAFYHAQLRKTLEEFPQNHQKRFAKIFLDFVAGPRLKLYLRSKLLPSSSGFEFSLWSRNLFLSMAIQK